MTSYDSSNLSSPNFSFLNEYDTTLVEYAARAERDFSSDPNTCLVKLRQFGELLARYVAARHGIETENEQFNVTISILKRQRCISVEVRDLFDILRLEGNEAIHRGSGDRLTALRVLMSAHRLAIWFHQAMGGDDLCIRPFRPPPDPADAQGDLREELDILRREAAEYEEKLLKAHGQNKKLESILEDQRCENQRLYSELQAKRELLDESEQELQVYSKLEQRLRNIKEFTGVEIESFARRSADAVYRLGLIGEKKRHLPIAQIRIQGPRISRCCNAPTLLVQSMSGGFVTANCSECGQKSGLRRDEFYDLNVWVSCPECRTRMDPAILNKNYGYKCGKCSWNAELSSMVPQWDEII